MTKLPPSHFPGGKTQLRKRKFTDTILPNFPHIIVILKSVIFPSNRLNKGTICIICIPRPVQISIPVHGCDIQFEKGTRYN